MGNRVRIRLPQALTCEITIPRGTALKMDLDDLVEAMKEATGELDPPVPTPAPPPPAPAPGPDPSPPAPAPVDPEPTVPIVGDLWFVDVNPARPFGSDQGTIPAGNGDKSGKPNRAAAQCEAQFDADGSDGKIDQIELWQPGPKVTPDAVMHTEYTPWVARVPDPSGSSAVVYRHRINKDAVRFDPARKADSFRAEVGGFGDLRHMPWGTEEFAAGGVFLPAEWATDAIASPGEWHVVFQWHGAEGDLTGNPPFAVYLRAGTAAKFNAVLRRYKDGLVPPAKGNQPVASSGVTATPGAWHWFVARYVADAGPGFSGDKPGMFALYHAEADGPLEEMFDYTGVWGSPNPSTEDGWKPGFWKTGLYCSTKFAGQDNRDVYTRGLRQYLARPGMTVESVLADFKASRT